ncbi:universal stress protein [Alkalilacustris brevis]|uniref:universal stress protein n=1 Tax=Alkalilacustris brevis TaxID=2026338 RepID=UPI000E0DF874|nr:universal stress protein [Alkalilacustris brevis]
MATIIAASDLSERSQEVLGRALVLGSDLGARVIFVHITSPGAPAMRNEDARQRMRRQVEETPLPGGTEPEIRVLNGRPELAIPALAAEEGADLVVLGLHRIRPVLDMLRMTTMERIVLRCDMPVLIAHIPASRPYRTVLSATDFAPACAAALAAAARLAPGAEFHAIHALRMPLRERIGSDDDPTRSSAYTMAESLRDAFCRMRGVPETLHTPEIVPGGVHEVLSFRLDELEPDLLTIGSHSGRDPMTLGNFARDLMREPPVDVLVSKPPRG